jgi:hypothetical protein
MSSPADLIRQVQKMIEKLPPEKKAQLDAELVKATGDRVWLPTPGPQLWAVNNEADETFSEARPAALKPSYASASASPNTCGASY